MRNKTDRPSAELLLRAAGFRATDKRVRMIDTLRSYSAPLTVRDILNRWRGPAPDITNAYRMLADFETAGIVRRVHLESDAAHFEYAKGKPHHDHAVCTVCGEVEDVPRCTIALTHASLARALKRFKRIDSHSAAFFGRCVKCA